MVVGIVLGAIFLILAPHLTPSLGLETILAATRAAGVLSTGLTFFPGETPVIDYGEAPYEFEADVLAISQEELI